MLDLRYRGYDLDYPAALALQDWMLTIDSDSPSSTYQGSYDVPFQRWFKFKEAFSPTLVKRLIDQSPIPVSRCLDVFGGCGTTGLTSSFLNVEPTLIEVNPFLIDVIKAKLGEYDPHKISATFFRWKARARELERGSVVIPEYLPDTFVERAGLDRWLFPRQVMRRIQCYKQALTTIRDIDERRLMRVVLASILVDVSNAIVNGKGRRYRANWEARQKTSNDVDAALLTKIESVIYDLTRFSAKPRVKHRILHGDARKMVGHVRNVDAVITSPPYPNSFDYTDIYNIELWTLGYLKNRKLEADLRKSTVRSHVQRRVTHDQCGIESRTLRRVLRRLHKSRLDLWSAQIPEMIDSYFSDLSLILGELRSRVTPGGQIALIVADSAYAGITVPVGEILAELGEGLGYKRVSVERLRSITGSAQQGWKRTLKEELVTMSNR